MTDSTKPMYFSSAAAFRRWLEKNATTSKEVIVGFKKRHIDKTGLSWSEAVNEALCVGWIDGVRRRIDDERYQIRFTPRQPGSTWSAVNIARIAVLQEQGRMKPAGLTAFANRAEQKSRTYSYEQQACPELTADETRQFHKNFAAWSFFQAQPPSYRKKIIWWLASPKQAATRQRRLVLAIEAFANGKRLL
jgi:uncharacterized protein YdeI (YjbR/CyaY-like superfamily)